MREHKFKVWDKTEKRMITKNIIEFYSDGGLVVQEQDTDKGVQRKIANPIIIEYTGKKDKNNVEIYEGDKLEYDNTKYPLSDGIYLIEWSDEECAFVCERQDPYNYLLPSVWHECEIIGNINKNPELVGGVGE